MPNTSVKVNFAALRRKLNSAIESSPQIKKLAYDRAYSRFKRAKDAMLRQFNEHPITAEIDAGPNGVNLSNTLDGYGNLFSFIGFFSDAQPTEELKRLLETRVTFRPTVFRNGSFYFRITYPSRDEIENVTKMPWEQGNSWAYEVESGISGLSNYMFKRWDAGRSGRGIQLPFENQEDLNFTPRPYISEILADFRDRINNAETTR